MLTAEAIQKNYEKHIKIIDAYIPSRAEIIKNMIEDLGDNYVLSPASSKTWYHGAFPGGYIDHVNRVVRYALREAETYRELGGTIDFTTEELVFSALFHDLGKIGEKDKPNYLPQRDTWRQEKLSEMYTSNPNLDFMLIPDRSLFLLQRYGIKINLKEYLAIKLHDGIFEEGNTPYFRSNVETSRQKTNIISILHVADLLASKVEYDIWKQKSSK